VSDALTDPVPSALDSRSGGARRGARALRGPLCAPVDREHHERGQQGAHAVCDQVGDRVRQAEYDGDAEDLAGGPLGYLPQRSEGNTEREDRRRCGERPLAGTTFP
jgi:hypothetical protein